MEGFIYKVTNQKNGKIYIGQTSRTIEERWNQHKRNAFQDNNLEYQNKFHRAIRKYGIGGFIIEQQEKIIATNTEELHQKLNDAETKWILHFDSKDNGYNSSLGGDYNPMRGVKGKDNPCSVKVNQYTLDGKYIKTWDSFADIIRELGDGNYAKVCSPKRLEFRKVTAKGYVWRHFTDDPKCEGIKISQKELDIRNAKNQAPPIRPKVKIDKLTLDDEYICTYDSMREAANAVDGDPSGITVVAKGRRKSYKGFHWKYHE